MATIDLNCDVGEGVGRDAEILPWVTSANVACGAHAGDETTMAATMALARRLGKMTGAHPGYADRAHFGRRDLALSPAEIESLVFDQLTALARYGEFHYVKPHGALYNRIARDAAAATAVARAVARFEPRLGLLVLSGSVAVAAGRDCGLRVWQEVFADRGYDSRGHLLPRDAPGALIEDPVAVGPRVVTMVREGRVQAVDGDWIAVAADSVCLHGDNPQAVEFARRLRRQLIDAGVEIRPFVTS